MSTAPSKTGCYDSFTTNLQDKTEPATSTQSTNPTLGVFDLTLMFKDGTPIRGNRIPTHNEVPVLFTVKFTNKPEDVSEMVMNVTVSELSKGSLMKGASGKYVKYVSSMTYKDTVPIVCADGGHSMTIEIGHAAAHSGAWHGGEGPYDVCMNFSPVAPGIGAARSVAAVNVAAVNDADDDDEYDISQIDETLRYTFYNPKTHFLARLFYAVSRFWDGI